MIVHHYWMLSLCFARCHCTAYALIPVAFLEADMVVTTQVCCSEGDWIGSGIALVGVAVAWFWKR